MLIVFLKSNTDKTYPLLDTNSREGKTASVIHSPGESPIPEGTVRRFHVTGADPEDIKSKGILQSSARGIEGPKAIYSFDNWKHAREYGGDKSPVVEFWDHPESYNDHPQARIGDVPPNQIVQVHEPWHDRYRYLVNNPVAIDSARNLVSRDTEGSFKDYARALAHIDSNLSKSILTKQDLKEACKDMDWSPTETQREAGNYKKAKVNIHGLTITIENPVGSVRAGTDRDGKQWSVKIKHPYGYINRTVGADAPDQVDVLIGPTMDAQRVYVVNQTKVWSKEFDEHKCVICCNNKSEAKQVYLDNYSPGWKNYSTIVELSLPEFKEWLENGDMSKPLNPDNHFPKGNQLKKSFDIIVILSKADPLTDSKPSVPPFYSGLHRHFEAKLPNRATPEQVQGMVKNFPKEEVESSGIGKHLSVHFRPSNVDGIRFPDDWTKKNLLDTVKRNAPIIEETHYADDDRPISLSDPVTIGEDPRTNISEYKVHHPGIGYLGKIHSIRGEGNSDIFHLSVTHPYGKAGDELYSSGQFGNLEDAVYAAQSRANERTKNSRYKINENNKPIYTPGIKNYRELLMHLPSKGTDNEDDYEEDDYSHPSAMDEPLKAKGDYHGPHWEVPNVVAHLRMGELNDKDGKPVTHLDEIQSDWGQSGKKNGYQTKEDLEKINAYRNDLESKIREAELKRQSITNDYFYNDDGSKRKFGNSEEGDNAYKKYAESRKSINKETEGYYDALRELNKEAKSKIPDFPFKKNWHELAFKRGIRHSAEQGHDKLTWDMGDTHNDRYNLAHHAKSIEFSPETNKLRVHTPSGNVQDLDIPDGKLEEYVGKDIADKLMNSSGGDDGSFTHKLDLDKNTTVGGSGHRYFYDQMIPSYAKKLSRMYGGNYGQSEVQTENGPKTVHHLELSPEMKRVALEEGFPMFGDRDPLKKSFDVVFMLKSYTYHPLEQQAIDYFGTTGNPREAGYVLRDGTMLDFSGKKFGRGDRGYSRAMDHTEIGAIGCRPVDFMDQVGAVRFHSNPTGESYAALVHPLSPHQENAIRATARIGRPFSIDAGKKNAPIGGEYYQYPYHAYQDSVDFASPGKTKEMIAEASKIAANTLHIPVQPRLDGLNKSTTANVLFKAYKATQHTPEETEKLYTAAKELHGHGNAVKDLKDKHWLYPDGTFSKSFGHYHPFVGAIGLTHAESANDIYEKSGVPIPDVGYENNYMDARAGLGRAGMIRITPRKNGYAVETASRPTPHQMSSIQQLYSMYKPSRDADSEWGGFDYDVRHPVTDQNVGYGNNLGDFYKHLEQAYGDNTEKAVILKAFKSTQHTPEEIDKLHATAKELLGHGSSAKETTGKAFLYPDGTFTKRIDKMDPIRGYRVGSHPGKAYDVYRNSGVNVPDIGYGDNYMDAHAGLTRTGMIRTTPMGNGYGFDMAARPTPSQMSTMQQMHDAFRPFGDEEEGGFHYEIRHPETDKYVASGDKISDLHNHLNEVFGPEDVEKSALGDFGRNVYGAAKRGLSKFIGIFKPAKPAPTENVPKEEIPKPEAEPKVSGVPKEPEELKTTELPPAELPEPVTAESPDAPSGGGVNLPKGTPSSPNAPSFSSQHENCQCSVINAGGGKQQWVLGPKACKNCQKMAQDFNNYHMDEQPDDESHNPDHAETEDGLD